MGIAFLEFNSGESMATPCSVNTSGLTFENFTFKSREFVVIRNSFSSLDNSNIKSSGNLSRFLFTCS